MNVWLFVGGFFACYAALLQLYLFYVHNRLYDFIEYLNKNKDIMGLNFHVQDFYFPFYLSRCHYGFALYMYKKKEISEDLLERFPDYFTLRRLSCIAFFSHLCLGVVAIVTVILRHLILR